MHLLLLNSEEHHTTKRMAPIHDQEQKQPAFSHSDMTQRIARAVLLVPKTVKMIQQYVILWYQTQHSDQAESKSNVVRIQTGLSLYCAVIRTLTKKRTANCCVWGVQAAEKGQLFPTVLTQKISLHRCGFFEDVGIREAFFRRGLPMAHFSISDTEPAERLTALTVSVNTGAISSIYSTSSKVRVGLKSHKFWGIICIQMTSYQGKPNQFIKTQVTIWFTAKDTINLKTDSTKMMWYVY